MIVVKDGVAGEFVGKEVSVFLPNDPSIESMLNDINFDVLTPGDQVALFRTCRMRGIDIARYQKIQLSISRFSSAFWSRCGVGKEGAFVSSSTKTLISVWSTFYRWCEDQNFEYVLPASEEVVQQYLTFRSNEGISKNTLSLDAWAISKLHSESGCIDPTKEPRVKDFIKNLKKKKVMVDQDITRQASGLRGAVVKKLIADWSRPDSTLKNKRDLAIILVGYFTLLRASELSRIKLSDIDIDVDGGAVIKINVSKTNHSGEPDVVYVNEKQMGHVFNYLRADGRTADDDSYLFGMVSGNGKISIKSKNALTVHAIRSVMGVAWDDYGKEMGVKRRFTAHSTRVGGAQDMRQKEIPLLDIMHAGRWSNISMVVRYTRDINAKQSSAVALQNDF